MAEEQLISLAEASAQFGISHSHLKLLARTEKLRAFKIGRGWVTTPEAVAEYLKDTKLRLKDPYKHKRT